MKLIDNTSHLLGDDLKDAIGHGTRLRIAASCFSIYAFEALKSELSKIDSLQFTFSVAKTCLVRFDNNKYSVMSTAVGRPVDIHAYADRIARNSCKRPYELRRDASELDAGSEDQAVPGASV